MMKLSVIDRRVECESGLRDRKLRRATARAHAVPSSANPE